jgi:hypothetical protein
MPAAQAQSDLLLWATSFLQCGLVRWPPEAPPSPPLGPPSMRAREAECTQCELPVSESVVHTPLLVRAERGVRSSVPESRQIGAGAGAGAGNRVFHAALNVLSALHDSLS